MNFHETIQLQALRLKQLNTGSDLGLADVIIDDAIAKNLVPFPMKNICAHISQELFDRVNGTCQMLEISKRRFVEMALVEALEKAESIVADIDPFATAEEREQRSQGGV